MKLWRRAAGIATWRHRALEIWRYAAALATWRHWGNEVWRRATGVRRHEALEAHCRYSDVEI
jgi:hypothetical protein